MRRELLYLTDIVEAANHISEFIEGMDLEAFLRSELTRSAVAQKLMIIGEAAAKVSPETRERHGHIPWLQIAALRNVLIHAYFGIDWPEVWESSSARCPVLREQVAKVLVDVRSRSDGHED